MPIPNFEIITIVAVVVAIICLLISLKKPNKTLPVAALIISTGAAIQAIYSPSSSPKTEDSSQRSFEKLTQAFNRLDQLPSPRDQFRVWYPEDPRLSPITTVLSRNEKNSYLEERRKIID